MSVECAAKAQRRVAVLVDRPAVEYWQLLCIERLSAVVEIVLLAPAAMAAGAGRRRGRGMRRHGATMTELGKRWPLSTAEDDPGRAAEALGAAAILCFGAAAVTVGPVPAWHLRIGAGGDEPIFWEALRGLPTVTAQLIEQRDGKARVLREGVFGVAPRRQNLRRTIDMLLEEIGHWPAAAVEAQTTEAAAPVRSQPSAPTPKAYHRVAYAARAAFIGVRRVQRALTEHAQWRVGLIDADMASVCLGRTSSAVRWLELPARDVAADPFVIGHDGGHMVMYERLDALADRKEIWWARIAPDGRLEEAGPAGGLPDYASYPNTFRLGDEIVCVPEAHRENEVALYRARAFPWSWEKVHVLVAGRELLDPTLAWHDGRWWLFCTDRRRGPNYNLFLWHAERIEGPWREHPANPVRTDIRGARPAGPLFVHQGRLFRPAQDCSVRYGRRLAVQEVLQLDGERFREVTAAVVEPPEVAYGDGIHTVCGADGVTVIDGRRTRFRLPLVGRRLANAGRQWARQVTT